MTPEPRPRDFGDYELLELIGSGGMGSVWLARDKSLGALWVVKLLKVALLDDPAIAERFRNEALTITRFRHDNIVRVTRFDSFEGNDFIVMEYLEGRTLSKWIERFPKGLPVEVALLVLRDISAGLEHAHTLEIVHRDLKPANVILTRQGVTKIIDFGIARVGTSGSTRATMAFLGTAPFMSPEQAEGKSASVTSRSDLFSLGALAFELLTGQRLFKGTAYEEVIEQVKNAEIPSIVDVNPLVSRRVSDVFLQCLERQPERRPASAREVRDVIEDELEDQKLLRSGRDILERFATDPVSVQRDLATTRMARLEDSTVALDTRGQEAARQYDDALTKILTLDPGNQRARDRQQELRRKYPVELSHAPAPPPPVPKNRWVRPILLGLGIVVLVGALIGAALRWKPHPKTEGGQTKPSTVPASTGQSIDTTIANPDSGKISHKVLPNPRPGPKGPPEPRPPTPAKIPPRGGSNSGVARETSTTQLAQGTIQIIVRPKGDVYVDGSLLKGETVSAAGVFSVGAHPVRVKYGDCDSSFMVGVRRDSTSKRTISFYGTLTVVAPGDAGATAIVDQQPRGPVPVSCNLPCGRHTVELRKPGCKTVGGVKTIMLKPGGQERVEMHVDCRR